MQLGKSGAAYQHLLCNNVKKELSSLRTTAGSQKINTGLFVKCKGAVPNSASRKAADRARGCVGGAAGRVVDQVVTKLNRPLTRSPRFYCHGEYIHRALIQQ